MKPPLRIIICSSRAANGKSDRRQTKMAAARMPLPHTALCTTISASSSSPVPFSLTSPSAPQFLFHARVRRGCPALFSSPPTFFPYSVQSSFPRYQPQTPKPDTKRDGMPEEEAGDIGDCLVFEEGAFEDGPTASSFTETDKVGAAGPGNRRATSTTTSASVNPQNLVPEKWREVVVEINLSKEEKRKISQQLTFGSKVERRKVPVFKSEEYLAYKEMKLAQLKPVVLDNPIELSLPPPPPPPPPATEDEDTNLGKSSGERAKPRNPRSEILAESLDTIREFFESEKYVAENKEGDRKQKGSRKLYSKEEKDMLNKRIPDLSIATSEKWLPVHTLVASGDYYLMDMLLKHDVDINSTDWDGLYAIHKATTGRKQAILNYLLREAANPFVLDAGGATLMHYAVQTASVPAIKHLLLYNVDINLADNDGWTPLHLAVQGQRTDIVKLLLIKGADKTLKTKDGFTPLDLCLYLGASERTFELIKLLKMLPREKNVVEGQLQC